MSNNLVIVEKSPSFMQRIKAFFSTKAAQLTTVVTVIILNGVTPAHAIGVEAFEPIITLITGMVAIVSSIGMAVLTVYATSKVFKWVKTAF